MGSTLGARIRRVRESLALSQIALARLTGAGRPATVSNWERDRTTPEKGTLKLLADLTNAPEAVYVWLLEGGEAPNLSARTETNARTERDVVPPPSLPPTPPRNAALDQVHHAYADFTRRVASLAGAGKSVPAHYLLEWAAMLLRTHELYRLTSERLDLVLRELPQLIFEMDQEGRIVAYHANAHSELYAAPEHFLHKRVQDVLPPLAAEALQRAIEVARTSVVAEATYDLLFKDGVRHCHARLYLLPDEHLMVFVQRHGGGRATRG